MIKNDEQLGVKMSDFKPVTWCDFDALRQWLVLPENGVIRTMIQMSPHVTSSILDMQVAPHQLPTVQNLLRKMESINPNATKEYKWDWIDHMHRELNQLSRFGV